MDSTNLSSPPLPPNLAFIHPPPPPNQTFFSNHDHTVLIHILILIYHIFVILVGLIGNTIVIYATLRYHTFGLDKITVYFMRHLAIADIGFIIFGVIPAAVYFFLDYNWVFGDNVCTIQAMIKIVPGNANIAFIFLISLNRICRVLFPVKSQLVELRDAKMIAGGAWVLAVILVTIVAATARSMKAMIWVQNPFCELYEANSHVVLGVVIVAGVVPFVCIVVMNIWLWVVSLMYIFKFQSRYKQIKAEMAAQIVHSSITTICISCVFIVAWFPVNFRYLWRAIDGKKAIPKWLDNSYLLYYLNTFGNCMVYSLVNKHFKAYLVGRWDMLNIKMRRAWKRKKRNSLENFSFRSMMSMRTRTSSQNQSSKIILRQSHC